MLIFNLLFFCLFCHETTLSLPLSLPFHSSSALFFSQTYMFRVVKHGLSHAKTRSFVMRKLSARKREIYLSEMKSEE